MLAGEFISVAGKCGMTHNGHGFMLAGYFMFRQLEL
jgi:hypothetical protein